MDEKVKISAKVIKQDGPDANGNVYTNSALADAVETYNKKCPKFEHHYKGSRYVKEAVRWWIFVPWKFFARKVIEVEPAFKVLNAEMNGNDLHSEIRLLDTTGGKVVEDIVKSGKARFIPSWKGKIGKNGVVEDLEMISMSCVNKSEVVDG